MANLLQSGFPSLTTEFEAFLGQVAESARALSGATGSAIAIRNGNDRDGEDIRCVARSGDSAPPLQSRLDSSSGISGECLVTGSVLHCADTAADHRVDPEVCRQLGLRSIVVLPVRGRNRTAGVLEVFSTQPHAFTPEHVDSLKSLTELIEMACASTPDDGLPELTAPGPHNHRADSVPPATQQTQQSVWAHMQLPFPLSFLKGRRGYWIAGGGLAMLLLATLISLQAFRSRGHAARPSKVAQAAVNPSPPQTAEIVLPQPGEGADRPTPHPRHNASVNNQRHGLQAASRVEVLTRTGDSLAQDPGSLRSAPPIENPSPVPGPDADSNQTPVLPFASNSITPEALLEPSVDAPRASPAASQAASGGTLVHRVSPIYPPEARGMKLEGEVVLEAVITKTGRVRDVKLLKGSPILARAAMDAVKQWHYQPYRLNGEPLESQTEIRVQFHAQ